MLLWIWCLHRWTRPPSQRIRPCGFPSFLFVVACMMQVFHACRAATSVFGTIKHRYRSRRPAKYVDTMN